MIHMNGEEKKIEVLFHEILSFIKKENYSTSKTQTAILRTENTMPTLQKNQKRVITDPHFHAWSPDTHKWLSISPKAKKYTVKDFLSETSKYDIQYSVYIQCGHSNPLQEITDLQKQSPNNHGHPQGIIGFVDLREDNLEAILKEYMKSSNFRGAHASFIIFSVHIHHPPHLSLSLFPKKEYGKCWISTLFLKRIWGTAIYCSILNFIEGYQFWGN